MSLFLVKCKHNKLPSLCGFCMSELKQYAGGKNMRQLELAGLVERFALANGDWDFRILPKGRQFLAGKDDPTDE